MNERITEALLEQFQKELEYEEKAKLTIEKYMRDIRKFYSFLPEKKMVTQESVLAYKEYLKENYSLTSANSMIVALNAFLEYGGWGDMRIRQFKIQKQFFCRVDRFMTKSEYERLVEAAEKDGDWQLSLIMQTLCSTGIRIGELKYIDVEAVSAGFVNITQKGKTRMVFLTKELTVMLQRFCRRSGIRRGPIFLSGEGTAIDRSVVWRKMKHLCKKAHVEGKKVFPHNLRHLFAFTFYRRHKDLLRLAEVLGHSSIETTRIYTVSTGKEHLQMLSKLGLICRAQNVRNT